MKTTGAEIGTTHACSAPKSEDHARPPAVFADDGSLSYREAYLRWPLTPHFEAPPRGLEKFEESKNCSRSSPYIIDATSIIAKDSP